MKNKLLYFTLGFLIILPLIYHMKFMKTKDYYSIYVMRNTVGLGSEKDIMSFQRFNEFVSNINFDDLMIKSSYRLNIYVSKQNLKNLILIDGFLADISNRYTIELIIIED